MTQVNYSGLNYKDGMAICGIYGVVETLPLITGIDFVGVVDVTWPGVAWPGNCHFAAPQRIGNGW